MEIFHRFLKDIILVLQIHKIVFTPVTLPRKAVSSYFCLFFCIVKFLMLFNFLRTIKLLHIMFFFLFLLVLIRRLHYKRNFWQYLLLYWEPFCGFLALILGYAPLFLRVYLISSYDILYRCFSC